jgi:hypothetical protein
LDVEAFMRLLGYRKVLVTLIRLGQVRTYFSRHKNKFARYLDKHVARCYSVYREPGNPLLQS